MCLNSDIMQANKRVKRRDSRTKNNSPASCRHTIDAKRRNVARPRTIHLLLYAS